MSKYWNPGPESLKMQGFQVISTSIRRDGVYHRSHGVFPKLADAMAMLTKVEAILEPCWVAGVRGLPEGCPADCFDDYKAPVGDSRPFKLYAVKASAFPVPQHKDIVWEATWGRTENEAKLHFVSQHKKPRLEVLTIKELELELEKDLLRRMASVPVRSGRVSISDMVEQVVLWQQLETLKGGAGNGTR